jgi:hypothetical protein
VAISTAGAGLNIEIPPKPVVGNNKQRARIAANVCSLWNRAVRHQIEGEALAKTVIRQPAEGFKNRISLCNGVTGRRNGVSLMRREERGPGGNTLHSWPVSGALTSGRGVRSGYGGADLPLGRTAPATPDRQNRRFSFPSLCSELDFFLGRSASWSAGIFLFLEAYFPSRAESGPPQS